MALRIPLSWLQDFVDLDQSPNKLAEVLTISGMEVESIEHLGGNWGDYCRVGEVQKVVAHPNADSLSIATVDYGTDQSLEVVTGAPNIRELENSPRGTPPKVALALSGATLVDPYHDHHPLIRLKPSKIRGILSEGMICSELELGLGEAHEGVLFLPEDAPVGRLLKDYLGDSILEFDIKGGFAHLLSIFGLARETAAITRMRLKSEKLPDLSRLIFQQPNQKLKSSEADFVKLKIEDPSLCPRYSALLVRGIKIGPSPFWLQQRLQRAGMRPINNIVDITNYVMLELGQPLHAFDYQALCQRAAGDIPEIIIRAARNGEILTTLDGEERKLDDQMLMITDRSGLIAIAGVMGGEETEVDKETCDVLLESANFDFLNNRRTSQLLKLKTEASERFGKRLNADGTMTAALRAAELCESIAGGTLEVQAADLYPGLVEDQTVDLDLLYLERVLGIQVEKVEVIRILEALGFSVETMTGEEKLHVTVPPHRLDIDIPADLVEEIARVHGYNRMPSTLIRDALPPQRENIQLQGVEWIRDILTGSGLDEIITYTMTSPLDESYLFLREGFEEKDYVPVRNPLSNERSHLRRKLLPGALHSARQNLRFEDQVHVFETGGVFIPEQNEVLPKEPMELCLLMIGKREKQSWHDAVDGDMDFFDMKGVIENLFATLHLLDVEWKKSRQLPYHPGRCSEIISNGVQIGIMGELHPDVRRLFELPDRPVVCAELQLHELMNAVSPHFLMEEISSYAPIYEDLAFVVDGSIEVETLVPFILKNGKPLLKNVQLFDVFQGEGLGDGKKSLGFSMTYQAKDRTLSDKEVEKIRNRIIKKVNQNFQATLRES
ncbi:MAG: phenylalanine--tRNA ligase subunit beta [SAR324 cluster bacterium]|jgi:phenylalanyl-tRNA synthetase beta chain|nr:phenylalanine--tRNA ligase subunit beta [SAR324 cluster bacterium]MDP7138370.1 phenylalanine--tRNA ligase subunit beta [SAR324 cluster bacterium]HJM05333.1 phenylalanine--tRNA ligase subunit beta [SAR324 cluster bacterium]|tara:strand:- start:3029 stop:5542 length:2514 start_codon:yes stop_codon:yes gene_type:complete